jgi:hypothetical protein
MSAKGKKATSLERQLLAAGESGLCMILAMAAHYSAWGPDHDTDARELQRLEICKSLRSPIQVLARSASALRAAVVLPRDLCSSASP